MLIIISEYREKRTYSLTLWNYVTRKIISKKKINVDLENGWELFPENLITFSFVDRSEESGHGLTGLLAHYIRKNPNLNQDLTPDQTFLKIHFVNVQFTHRKLQTSGKGELYANC